MVDKRYGWKVLGRVIGTVTGWDQADRFIIELHDFKPAKGVSIKKAECLCIDFESGCAIIYDDNGQEVYNWDLIMALRNLPLAEVE